MPVNPHLPVQRSEPVEPRPAQAISITGLQCTGKTTLARALGRSIGAVVFSRDPLMDVLSADGVPLEASPTTGLKGYPEIGYDLLTALLRSQLDLGQSVVLECVVGPKVRSEWRDVATEAGAQFWFVDMVCSDARCNVKGSRNGEHSDAVISKSPGKRLISGDDISSCIPVWIMWPTPSTPSRRTCRR